MSSIEWRRLGSSLLVVLPRLAAAPFTLPPRGVQTRERSARRLRCPLYLHVRSSCCHQYYRDWPQENRRTSTLNHHLGAAGENADLQTIALFPMSHLFTEPFRAL